MQRCETEEACKMLIINEEKLKDISHLLLVSLKDGLTEEKHETAAVRCYQTYVQDFPTGNENGTFLALDLGGTNFRVLSIKLARQEKPIMIKETYELPEEKKTGAGEALFDYVAECIIDFCEKHRVCKLSSSSMIPMGFTFSFPVHQIGLNRGILIKWTKGFMASDVEGNDVVQLLTDAFTRRNLTNALSPVAILNDTTGTLMACAMDYPDCKIGLICGTGTNACYTERIENIERFDGDPNKPYMVINCEWGNFGADGKLEPYFSEYDIELMEASTHKYNQAFEKCVSGRYLGEIMRLIVIKLIKAGVLFNGNSSKILLTPYTFESRNLTEIEKDSEDGPFVHTEQVVKNAGILEYEKQDLIDFHYISRVLSTRSGALIGAGVATLLNKMELSPVTVAVDGTVYRQHTNFKKVLHEVTKALTKPEIQFKFVLSEDGSGRGAAFVAAVAASSRKKTEKD